ncbi:sulfite exporter TauE/SafE family protein [Paenibacillus chondroitinus]|uniref:Sulfite exporter TauE/SafE family protein n=2 Tax=Paenibacillus TaxID=44249 RepID=A0ABU6DGL1_9BACL|nr:MULTISPECIES: sulfite exporter TauE/SafE family protein [Paenibacillus]MCY9659506.1 sulfite exporter TauE/SafE family protein [Paenibacillus anseongense]MEB4796901.1 sulfite exporter TauE/SafE family protein [Paenibacillus chondroitinus]
MAWTFLALAIGILIAGFWNYKAVDDFGRDVVAGNIIGNTSTLAGTFGENGFGFDILFALAAGLAATFTACNCVMFAMLPGLTCSTDRSSSRKTALRALGVFSLGVLAVTAIYGLYVGSLGPDAVQAYNERQVRLSQASNIFTILGLFMLVWGAISSGFLNTIVSRIPSNIRSFFANPLTKAGLMGLQVGFFAVGRPFGVFRDFLTYAATTRNPLYGALMMSIQGIGQIALMVILFLVVISVFGKRLARLSSEKPHQVELISVVSLLLGGAYFVFYWGMAVPYGIGRWGEIFGLY